MVIFVQKKILVQIIYNAVFLKVLNDVPVAPSFMYQNWVPHTISSHLLLLLL